MNARFRDRQEAGQVLAASLRRFAGRSDVIVLALPRGGVPVAVEVARALNAPMDVLIVRKLGLPGHEELAMGAVASGGVLVTNAELVRALGIPQRLIEARAREARVELDRRERCYRQGRPPPDLRGRTVIVIDDGLATGATTRAALGAVRALGASRVVVAVPVAAPEAVADLARDADEVVCPRTPEPFFAIGAWYEDFPQFDDDEVRSLLGVAAAPAAT